MDCLPPLMLKNAFDSFGLFTLRLVNTSLILSGGVPLWFKQAIFKPLFKKYNLDQTSFSNFRPTANLNFISKILEKIVQTQHQDYLFLNNILLEFQSGFKPR